MRGDSSPWPLSVHQNCLLLQSSRDIIYSDVKMEALAPATVEAQCCEMLSMCNIVAFETRCEGGISSA